MSQRSASVGWELVATALRSVLRPLADPQEHPDAFHQGLRLIALDGTHQPLAAAFGWKNQGELTLARQACAPGTLPACSLLLGDRLFGTPSLMHELLPELESSGGGLLFRVKANMKSRLVEVLGDGSRLVDVEVRDTETRKLIRVLRLREIHAEVHVEDGKDKPLKIRLWTNLLDVALHPAQALVELYAMRWEHELFYRELKSHLHGGGNLLKAQTPESAAQEALAMMMAASLIARQRAVVAAKAGVEMRRVSFAKVLDATVALCRVLEIGRDRLDSQTQTQELYPWPAPNHPELAKNQKSDFQTSRQNHHSNESLKALGSSPVPKQNSMESTLPLI